MAFRTPRGRRAISWPAFNRLAQLNVAVAICIAGMIRCSLEFKETEGERPDALAVLAFFALMAAAIVLILYVRKEIHRLRSTRAKLISTLATFALQFVVLQVLVWLVN